MALMAPKVSRRGYLASRMLVPMQGRDVGGGRHDQGAQGDVSVIPEVRAAAETLIPRRVHKTDWGRVSTELTAEPSRSRQWAGFETYGDSEIEPQLCVHSIMQHTTARARIPKKVVEKRIEREYSERLSEG